MAKYRMIQKQPANDYFYFPAALICKINQGVSILIPVIAPLSEMDKYNTRSLSAPVSHVLK